MANFRINPRESCYAKSTLSNIAGAHLAACRRLSDEVVVLAEHPRGGRCGDDLEALADVTGLRWETVAVECTSYWKRPNDCPTTPLDHILSNVSAQSVEAAGACDAVGCDADGACPTYVERVSDHCPVSGVF